MAITRSDVQSFLDGFKAGKAIKTIDLSNSSVPSDVQTWLKEHPLYPQSDDAIQKIVDDLSSYLL